MGTSSICEAEISRLRDRSGWHDISPDYKRGDYFGHEVVTAICLPDEGRDLILSDIQWQPVETAKLKGEL